MGSENTQSLHDDDQLADAQDREKARRVVNDALVATQTPLSHRNLSHRLLPGLWNAAIYVLLEYCSSEEAIALINDRLRGIVGSGDNADAPPRVLAGQQKQIYYEEVRKAGATILECLEPAFQKLEEAEIEGWFPETVLDSSLIVLLKGWGPDHVRRALREQAALIVRGITEPLLFQEPSRNIRLNENRADAKEQVERETDPVAEPLPLREKWLRAEASIDAYIYADVAESGFACWAVHVAAAAAGREEERFMYGVRKDPAGRSTWIEALKECLHAMNAWADSATARIHIGSLEIARAADNTPGARLPSEAHLWDEIDDLGAGHVISYKHRELSLDNPIFERCDRRIRDLLSAAETEGE